MGVVGLETAFPTLYTYLVKTGVLTLEKLVELMSTNPRERFGVKSDAGQTVFLLDEDYTVNPDTFVTMGRATPLKDMTVSAKCLLTVYDGKAVYIDEKIK